jgi:hypothetical protein
MQRDETELDRITVELHLEVLPRGALLRDGLSKRLALGLHLQQKVLYAGA